MVRTPGTSTGGTRDTIRRGRCRKGVDPVLEGHPKFIAIDEEANHEIVHRYRFGKAHGATYKPFNPGPQIEVRAFDFLRVLLANVMLLWVDMPLVRPPPIGVKPRDPKRLKQTPFGRTIALARRIPWSHRYILGSQSEACRPDTHHETWPCQPPHQ